MCSIIGIPPISTNGLGLTAVSSASLDPKPPANKTTFIQYILQKICLNFVFFLIKC